MHSSDEHSHRDAAALRHVKTLDPFTVFIDAVALAKDDEPRWWLRGRLSRCAPQVIVDAGHGLTRRQRLVHVFVDAAVQSERVIGLVNPCRENNYLHGDTFAHRITHNAAF